MAFQIILFKDDVKPHIVPVAMTQDLVDEIYDRFQSTIMEVHDREAGKQVSFDLGGPISALNNWYSVTVDGVVFNTLLRDVELLYVKLKNLQPRILNGKVYFKLHANHHAVMLTEAQRQELLDGWSNPEVETLLEQEEREIDNVLGTPEYKSHTVH